MIEIDVQNITKAFEKDKNILDGISFHVDTGEVVGILGKNGAGKTTLFRLLVGELTEDTGEIVIAPGRKIGLISQIPVYPETYTVENVLHSAFRDLDAIRLRMEELEQQMQQGHSDALLKQYDALMNRYSAGGGYDTDVNTDKVCNGLGIPQSMRERLFSALSGGEKTRVNLARLLLEKTDILLLDEPTNHLDMHAIEWLEDYVLHFKGTVLTISHDRYFLDRTVDRIIEIRDGKAEFYNGNYSFFVVEKQAREELKAKQYEKEQAKIAQLEKAAEQLATWAYSGMDKTYRRVVNIQHRIERMRTTDKPKTERTMHAQFQEKEFRGDEILSVKNISKSFGERTLFSDVEMRVGGGERIAFLGDNGAGKSTFLKILMQEMSAETGKIRFGPSVQKAYLPQIIHFEHPERTLLDTMLYEAGCDTQTARNRLGSFLFSGEDVFKTVSMLSGGEQMRLRLCILMDRKINLLILDEPTNHLDIATREWMEGALADYEGTLIFISHDRYFVDMFATRIWELENGKIRDFACGYEKYRSIKEHEQSSAQASAQKDIPKEKKEKREKPKTTANLEKQITKLEREIERQEETVASFEARIMENADNYVQLTEILAEKTEQESILNAMYAQWEALATQQEKR